MAKIPRHAIRTGRVVSEDRDFMTLEIVKDPEVAKFVLDPEIEERFYFLCFLNMEDGKLTGFLAPWERNSEQ